VIIGILDLEYERPTPSLLLVYALLKRLRDRL
jgi:hypothetical protein